MAKAFNNWKVVLLSILGATTFWFFNALNKNYDTRITYPIEFQFERDSVVIMEPLQSSIEINVSGGGWNLLRKTFWDPVQIPLENPTEIKFYTRASLTPMVEDQLSQLTINYLVTDTVYIDIEARMTRKVVLKLDSASIPLEENHRLTSPIVIQPDTVQITGPRSMIDSLGPSYPIQLEINGISRNFDRSVEVKLPTHLALSKPEKVQVSFNVEKFERYNIEVEVEPVNFPKDSSVYLSNETVQIFYTIPESRQEDFDSRDFAVTADLKMMNRRDSTVIAILVYHPEQALELEVIPEHLKVVKK